MDAKDFIKSDWIKGSELPAGGKVVKATITEYGEYRSPEGELK